MNYAIHTKLQDTNWELSSKWMTFRECKKLVRKMQKGPLGSSCMYQIANSAGQPVDDEGYPLPQEEEEDSSPKAVTLRRRDLCKVFMVSFSLLYKGASQSSRESVAMVLGHDATLSTVIERLAETYECADVDVEECSVIYKGSLLQEGSN